MGRAMPRPMSFLARGSPMTAITVAVAQRLELGESILWDGPRGLLAWVDIHKGDLWQGRPGAAPTCLTLPDRVGAIGLRADKPGHVVALAKGFALVDATGHVTPLAAIETDRPGTRLNDGRSDPFGNFLCGGMRESGIEGSALYRLRPDGRVDRLLEGIGCANATCFSPDGGTLYFADMPTGRIVAYPYHPDRPLGPGRLFFDFAGGPGLPDGATIDAEGCMWATHWGGGCITRHAPDGRVIARVALPVTNPTCLAFGGAGLDTLFISTATFGLDAGRRDAEPLAGAVLALRCDVPGLPEPRFAG